MGDKGPFLSGVRVIDFTRAFAGPLCTMILAELGADVIKVENPFNPDETRTWPPTLPGDTSGYYSALNRSKRSIAIDLKRSEGQAIAHALVEKADVVVENFRPGVVRDLRIDPETLRGINPRLVYCSISGFGQTGPYRDRRGYDPVLQAMGGLMGVTGEEGGRPVKSMIPVADYTTGLFATISVLAGILRQQQTGHGEFFDTAMLDVMVALTSTVGSAHINTGLVPQRSGTKNPARVPSAAFECSDGVWIQLVPNQRQWEGFCGAVGIPELAHDRRFHNNDARIAHQSELYEILEQLFLTRGSEEWLKILEVAGVAAGPIYTLDRLFVDPQVVARNIVGDLEHPAAGVIKAISLPIRGLETSAQMTRYPPDAGEHTIEILRDLVGAQDSDIASLIETSIVAVSTRNKERNGE